MILYTVLAPEDIFRPSPGLRSPWPYSPGPYGTEPYDTGPYGAGLGMHGWEVPEAVETSYRGFKVLVHPVAGGRGRLVRLLSTDPNAYLDPGLAPGTIIDIHPASIAAIPPFAI